MENGFMFWSIRGGEIVFVNKCYV